MYVIPDLTYHEFHSRSPICRGVTRKDKPLNITLLCQSEDGDLIALAQKTPIPQINRTYAFAVVGCLWYLLATNGILVTTAFLFLPLTTTSTSVPALCMPSLI
jgi:hypothetical protein